jgi:hypothetical protein
MDVRPLQSSRAGAQRKRHRREVLRLHGEQVPDDLGGSTTRLPVQQLRCRT